MREVREETGIHTGQYCMGCSYRVPAEGSTCSHRCGKLSLYPLKHPLSSCTEFRSVLAFRQHHHMPYYFDCSDLYFICRLHPLTFDLHPCEKEVVRCEWMNVHELVTSQEVLITVHSHCMYPQFVSPAEHSPDPADSRPCYQQSSQRLFRGGYHHGNTAFGVQGTYL